MLLGLVAGQWFRASEPAIPIRRFLIAGRHLIAAALLLHFTGHLPHREAHLDARWTLFSGGVCFFFLAAFSWIIEVKNQRRWAFPLVVVGMNSIAAYLIAHFGKTSSSAASTSTSATRSFKSSARGLEPLLLGIAVMLTYWLLLYWMFRRKIFLRI